MTAIASQKASTTIRTPGWAAAAMLTLILGLATLALHEVGLVAADLTLPFYWDAPGAPDLARSLV